MKKTNYHLFFFFALVIILLILLSGCADVTNVQSCATTDAAGFLSGLWHGFICWVSFFGSLFSDNIAMYEVNNTGGWYDFGFVLGSGILLGGVGRSSK